MFRAIIVILLLMFATAIDGWDNSAHALKDEGAMTTVFVDYAQGSNRPSETVVDFGYTTDEGAKWILVYASGEMDEVPASEATLTYIMTNITPKNWKQVRKSLKEAQKTIKK